MLADLGTYLTKAIPDTKLTIRRYADAKFAYLSYCLKVKEMDDEEHGYAAIQEPAYRVETGNYEYRLVLRCRQEARTKFANLRSDVLEKMELLESKHARDLTCQLKRFIQGLATLGEEAIERMKVHPHLFPVEVDLKDSAFQYKSTARLQSVEVCGSEEYAVDIGEEIIEKISGAKKGDEESLIANLVSVDLNAGAPSGLEGEDLLKELGLADIDLSVGCTFDPRLSFGGGDSLMD